MVALLQTDEARFVPTRQTVKRSLIGLAVLGGVAAVAVFGYQYWTVGRYLVSTDDAYVKADYTTVAPKISGYIAAVTVRDNEHVVAGQVLARIDDRDYRNALDQAKADLAAAEASIGNLNSQVDLQRSIIDQNAATIVAARAALKFAGQDASRYDGLSKSGAGTVQHAEQSETTLEQAKAQLLRDQAGLAAAEKQMEVLGTAKVKAEAERDRARAIEHQAELNLSYATITAAVEGTVGARSLRVGQYVQAGTQLMAVVPLDSVYIVANFKETQLARVRAGQPAEITVDGFPGKSLRGHVDSLSPASGLEFALLPPDNATGNFTKIVQRVPVKIVLDDPALAGLLRSGMSVEPTIDTKTTGQGE